MSELGGNLGGVFSKGYFTRPKIPNIFSMKTQSRTTNRSGIILRGIILASFIGLLFIPAPGEYALHFIGRSPVGALEEMGIDVAGGGCAGVAEPAAYFPEIDTLSYQQRGRRMPQRVQGDMRKLVFVQEPGEPISEPVRVDPVSVPGCEYPVLTGPLIAKLQPLLYLLCFPLFQQCHCRRWNGKQALTCLILWVLDEAALPREILAGLTHL